MSLDPQALRRLVDAVQAQCHLADAWQASELPLCIYLLQMREYYRWEQGLPFGAELPRAAVGTWLAEREALWDTLAARELQALPGPDGTAFDPFDTDAVNAHLRPHGLVYGAGLLGPGRPVFFVARRLREELLQVDGQTVRLQVSGDEWARCLGSPPAVLDHAHGLPTIVLREAALARWLWERFEAHGLRPNDGPFHHLARCHGLADARDFNAALPRLLAELSPVLILHETGELRAGRRLDPHWAALRAGQAGNRRAELRLRAVRDLLADLDTTLPALLQAGDAAPIHFWFAGFEGHREALFPGLKRAYAAWRSRAEPEALGELASLGRVHFAALADELLALHAESAEADEKGDVASRRVALRLDAPSATCLA